MERDSQNRPISSMPPMCAFVSIVPHESPARDRGVSSAAGERERGRGEEGLTERFEDKPTRGAARVRAAGVPIGRAGSTSAAVLAVLVLLDRHQLAEHDADGARIVSHHILRKLSP